MSKLRVNDVLPANGLNIGIGTTNGSVTFNADITGGMNVTTGLVGLGTDIPSTTLDVEGSNVPVVINSSNSNTYKIQLENAGSTVAYIGAASNEIYFANASAAEQARFTDSGLKLPSGKGIDFSATTDATGMTSELLNDYEEGTWTPQLYIGSTQQTLDVSYGLYRKIGSVVFIKCHVSVSSISGTGAVQIRNLPFTQASGGLSQTALSVQWSGTLNEHAVYANTWTTGNIIQLNYSNGTGNTGSLSESDIAANSNFGIAGCYDV